MKKKYEKPQIREVKIIPEDATLSGCKKGAGAPGSGNKNCDHSGCKTSVYGS